MHNSDSPSFFTKKETQPLTNTSQAATTDTPVRGTEPVFLPMELGISYEPQPSTRVEKRESIDERGYHPTSNGTLKKVVVESIKKKSKDESSASVSETLKPQF